MLAIVDTETTGFLRKQDVPSWQQPEIVEFAGVLVDRETLKEADRLEFRVRTKQPLPLKIETLLQINDADLDFEPRFYKYHTVLRDFFGQSEVFCSHNVPFDFVVLQHNLARYNLLDGFPLPSRYFDTLEYSRENYPGPHKLRDLHYRLGCPPKRQSHRAMDDVEMLLDILRILVLKKGVKL